MILLEPQDTVERRAELGDTLAIRQAAEKLLSGPFYKAKCALCDTDISYKSGSIHGQRTNLFRMHLACAVRLYDDLMEIVEGPL